MADVPVVLQIRKADGTLGPLKASDAGSLLVETGLAPVLGAGLDVRLPQSQVDALTPLATQPVSGSVSVSNLPATQPVSGPLTDAQLRAAPLLVAAQTGIGNYEDGASQQGRYRFAGGKATTSVVSPNASITLSNPANSGVDLILSRYQIEVDASADIVLLSDAVSADPVVVNLNPNQRTSVDNPGVVRLGTGVLTGGTVASPTRRATTNAPVAVGPFRFRITPGRTFTVRFLGPGATNTVWLNLGWFVVPEGGDLA